MANGGFFLVYRQVWEHPMFSDEPLTKREAWLWLISVAAYSGTDRGQVTVSYRQLAKAWQWTIPRVHRLISRLKAANMIVTQNVTQNVTQKTVERTIITICNYDKFQVRQTVNSGLTVTPTVTPTVTQSKEDTSTLRFEVSKKKPARDFSNRYLSKLAMEPETAEAKAARIEVYRKRKAADAKRQAALAAAWQTERCETDAEH